MTAAVVVEVRQVGSLAAPPPRRRPPPRQLAAPPLLHPPPGYSTRQQRWRRQLGQGDSNSRHRGRCWGSSGSKKRCCDHTEDWGTRWWPAGGSRQHLRRQSSWGEPAAAAGVNCQPQLAAAAGDLGRTSAAAATGSSRRWRRGWMESGVVYYLNVVTVTTGLGAGSGRGGSSGTFDTSSAGRRHWRPPTPRYRHDAPCCTPAAIPTLRSLQARRVVLLTNQQRTEF